MLRAASGGAGPAPAFSAAYRDMARRLGYIFGDAKIIPVRKDRLLAAACLLLASLALVGLNPGLAGRKPGRYTWRSCKALTRLLRRESGQFR